jgi:transposase-like protein
MRCIRCGGERTRWDGQTRLGGQRWRCKDCKRRFTARSVSAFSGRGSADEVIALTDTVPRPLRLAAIWPQLALAI